MNSCLFSCSPDFTLSRVTSTLHLHTADGSLMDFPLLATLPHTMLATCYAALPHSELEEFAVYISVPLWMVALLLMILVTILQVMSGCGIPPPLLLLLNSIFSNKSLSCCHDNFLFIG